MRCQNHDAGLEENDAATQRKGAERGFTLVPGGDLSFGSLAPW